MGLRQLREIFDQLALRIAPREIGVALVKARFAQRFHHLWPGERFGKKNRVGIFLANACDQIFPKRDGLGVRIVHAKNAHTAFRPKQHDAFHLGPELAPVFASKVYRINVLILFRRVLRVFDRAVRPFVEPLGMFLDVRMIRRAINREIEGDFHSAFAHFLLQPIKILERA